MIDKTYLESHKIVKHILSHTENEGRLNGTSDCFLMIKFHVVQCICCGSILSLVQIFFSFVSNSLSCYYHTLPYPKTKEKKI